VPEDDDSADDRDLWRRHTARPVAPASACPDDGTLAAILDGRVSSAERVALEAHVAGCARCVAALGDALRIEQAPLSTVSARHVEDLTRAVLAERSPRLRLPGRLAVAAALLVTCGAGFLLGARMITDVTALERHVDDLPFDLTPMVSAP
jgi:hypothetical protein